MKLRPGISAIDFSVEDIDGSLISLRDYRGKKLLISFYRFTECIYCQLRIHELTKRYSEFNNRGLETLAFFQSPKEEIVKNVFKAKPLFPLIPDTRRKVFKAYKVKEDSIIGYLKGYIRLPKALKAIALGIIPKSGTGNKTLLPADFLISEDGKIAKAYYGKDIADYIPITEIEDFLKAPRKSFPHTDFSFTNKR